MISSFRAVGVIMVLCFLTAPVLSARFFFKRLYSLILYAGFLGVIISIVAVALSRHLLSINNLAVSTSGLTVLLLTLVFLIHALVFQLYKPRRTRSPQTTQK
ncbi:MAG: metal ABC transporter permease [Parachlamydiaceae bacterium]